MAVQLQRGSGRLIVVYAALCTEGGACLAGVLTALNQGMSRVIVETDPTCLAAALKDDSCYLCTIPRSCNVAAHELARFGLQRDPDKYPILFGLTPSHCLNSLGL
jgi:hypothetical protein